MDGVDAKATVRVRLGGGTPVAGDRISGVNHDAWSRRPEEWAGVSDTLGQHTWHGVGPGTPGDRFTFKADYVDPKGMKWTGEASERIRKETEIVLTLAQGGEGGQDST